MILSEIVKFNEEEEKANEYLLTFMNQVQKWGLICNENELTHAVHSCQMFLIKHMLQRIGAEEFSYWYE